MRKPVSKDGRDQLLGYLINLSQDQAATREWIETWLDAWCPLPTIDELIERSSLGTPKAKAIRAKAPRAAVEKTLARARELERKSKKPKARE